MNSILRFPFLLYCYLATEMLAPFFASFLIMNGVFFLVKLIPFLNSALELHIGFADFVRMFCYMLPNMLLYTLPMASMLGVIIGFSRLSSDTEILALKASGISMYSILPPIFIIAATIALCTGYISTRLIPASENAMQQLTYQLLKEKIDRGIEEYRFTEALGDLVIHVGHIDDETGQWKNVWVSDMRGQQTSPTITMSNSGRLISNLNQMDLTIVLENGSLHRPDDDNAQIVSFDKYIIRVPIQPQASPTSTNRRSLSMPELQAAAVEIGLDKKQGRRLLIEYHKRLVLPVGCLVLTILGLPLGLQAGPGRRAMGIPFGLAVFISYYVIFTFVRTLAKTGSAPIGIIMWVPNVVFILATIYCVRQVAQEKAIIPEFLHELFGSVNERILRPTIRLTINLYARSTSFIQRKSSQFSKEDENRIPEPTMLRGDVQNKIYHFPGCSLYLSSDCTTEFISSEVARQSGFKPCELCNEQYHNNPH